MLPKQAQVGIGLGTLQGEADRARPSEKGRHFYEEKVNMEEVGKTVTGMLFDISKRSS